MSSGNKWIRPISFNKKNKDDIKRLELIGKKSFSRYIKQLLDEEIKRREVLPAGINKSAAAQQEQRVITPKRADAIIPKKPAETPPPYNPMLSRIQR